MKFKQLLSAFRRPIEKYLLNFRVQHALYRLSPSTINCHLHVSVKDNVYVRRFSENPARLSIYSTFFSGRIIDYYRPLLDKYSVNRTK